MKLKQIGIKIYLLVNIKLTYYVIFLKNIKKGNVIIYTKTFA